MRAANPGGRADENRKTARFRRSPSAAFGVHTGVGQIPQYLRETMMEAKLDKSQEARKKGQPQKSFLPTDPAASRTREEMLKFLESLTQFLGAYHNHKETSAWASVGLFVLAAGQLLQHRTSYDLLAYNYKSALASVAVFLCGVTLLFMYKQFALRRQAARRIAACFRVRCALLAAPGQQVDPTNCAFPQGEFLPQMVLDEIPQLGRVGTASIASLESAAYVLVLTIGLGIAIRILA